MSDHSLTNQSKFEKALENYRPKIEVIDILNRINLVLLVAPAAAGRNTLIRNIMMTGKYHYVVSDTTRPPRLNNGVPEVNGREYWFCSEELFLDGLKRGDYLAPAIIHHQQASGISILELQKAFNDGKVAITDIDIQGCDNLQDYASNAHNLFILPPAFDEWMRRLDGRGTIDPEEKRHRLESAVNEISGALDRGYFKFIINWDVRTTSEQIHEYVTSGVYDESLLTAARVHADGLVVALRKALG
jgi:guanylate kinase